jgi:hypothetical protein
MPSAKRIIIASTKPEIIVPVIEVSGFMYSKLLVVDAPGGGTSGW